MACRLGKDKRLTEQIVPRRSGVASHPDLGDDSVPSAGLAFNEGPVSVSTYAERQRACTKPPDTSNQQTTKLQRLTNRVSCSSGMQSCQ